jgi:hypothetical protein
MLDPSQPQAVDLTDHDTYIASCLALADQRLGAYADCDAVASDEDELNKYPRLDQLSDPKDIFVPNGMDEADVQRAGQALLEGKVLLEHACAGEATRLGLGTKYLLNPPEDLTPEVMKRLLKDKPCAVKPSDLRAMTLGRRHMLQLAWDLWRLAHEAGQDPSQVLSRQHLLIVVNQATAEDILADFRQAGFYGFDRHKVLFMVQESFHGISKKEGRWAYDQSAPRRLHNHGQMLMQTTMDHQLFRLDAQGGRQTLTWAEYRAILEGMEDKISFNIEDLDYLERSLDLEGLAVALHLADSGARMVMEVVANDPVTPQKGGLCAWDPELKRNVMIESFQLAGLPNERITFLNKNINHYPFPAQALGQARERGLAMPIAVKKGFLYYQPIQGDVNFLVPTSFWRRSEMKPIKAWKSEANTAAALEAMAGQENRPGFLDWAREISGLDL